LGLPDRDPQEAPGGVAAAPKKPGAQAMGIRDASKQPSEAPRSSVLNPPVYPALALGAS
jgi:hypothetical protein